MRLRVRPILASFIIVLLAFIWIIFAPVQFGGLSSYVIVAGASMEPTLSMGDLVVVSKSQTYQIGDIVTYQHPLAGPIIHRIIDRQGEKYTFQGDNNDWVDSYQPTIEEMIGKLWLHIPRQGNLLRTLRSPVVLAGIALLVAVGIFSTFRKPDPAAKAANSGRKAPSKSPKMRDGVESLVFVLAAIAFASTVLGIAAFSKPVTVEDFLRLEYEMQGHFEYQAPAPPGIYNSTLVNTGDPIYFKLTDSLDVTFEFHFSAEELHDLEGDIRLNYELRDPGGWHRTFEISPMMSFSDEAVVIDGLIEFDQVHMTVADLEERTGFERPYYIFSVSPVVVAKARINGDEALEVFNPRLDFRMEDLQLYLISMDPDVSELEQITQSRSNFVEQTIQVANHLTVLGVDIPVRTARWISASGGVISFVGFLILGGFYLSASRDGEAARIGVRYGAMLVDIREGNFVNGYHRIEVEDIDDLARFAERTGSVILHEFKTSRHHYFVQEGNVTYHYATVARRRRSNQSKSGRSGSPGGSNGNATSRKGTRSTASRVNRDSKAVINPWARALMKIGEWMDQFKSRVTRIELPALWEKPVQFIKNKAGEISRNRERGSNDP